MITPTAGSLISTVLYGNSSAYASSFFILSSTTTRLTRTFAGTMTYLEDCFWSRPRGTFGAFRSPSSTRESEWETLVSPLRSTGVSNLSLISKAILVNSLHSCASPGSSMGTLAKRAQFRLSCSFWELWTFGSSATTITSPPLMPV